MPEVKWIVEWYDNEADVPHAVRDQYRDSHGLETVPVPVMSLDDLEAWLKGRISTLPDGSTALTMERVGNMLLLDLLAQVQAWKAQT